MKNEFVLLTLCLVAYFPSYGQSISRDAFGDQHNTATGWMQNNGQKLNTALQSADNLVAYTDGYGMDLWLMDKSTFKLSKTVHGTLPGQNDTTFAVSVKAVGSTSNEVNPEPFYPLPGISNFYYRHTGDLAEDVMSYFREIYWAAWTKISMQFYTSRGGPKLAFVCEPGGNPNNIKLQFEGQDSLAVDVYGTLKMYTQGKWLALSQAIAYQQIGGVVVPLPWIPHYVENSGIGTVTFSFGDYNPIYPLVLQIGAPSFGAYEVTEPRNLDWSTYVGSNNTDEFMATDVDATGDVYVTGFTYQNNFPIGTGYQVHEPYQEALRGTEDVVTMKFQASNKQILWATYQGGNTSQTEPADEWRGLDKGYDMAVYKGLDPDLEYVYVTGSTRSPDFPLKAREATIFANADMTGYTGGAAGNERAAFILGYYQFNGHLDWSTLLGTQNSAFWEADGLGVDVDEDGTLIWAGRITRFVPGTFTYPLVTPSGAFTRSSGGGFVVHFNSDYQIIWNTFFGSQEEHSGVFDVKLANVGQETKVFLTGVSGTGLDVYEPPGNVGFHQGTCGGLRDAYFAMFDLATYQLDHSTYWGGSAEEFGIALEVVEVAPHGGKNIWIGGLTKSTNLSASQLPAPAYPGALHQTTLGGDADGMLLVFSTIPTVDLQYGTLYGGAGSDAVLDLEVGKGGSGEYSTAQVFAVGETSSTSQMDLVSNSSLFHQDLLGSDAGSTKRDGFLLGINYYIKVPSWTTYYGGFHTDKCWGVSVSSDELFLVGGTNTDQTTFPLKEYDTTIPQDWYDGDLLNNLGNHTSGEYSFNDQSFNRPFDAEVSQYELLSGLAPDAFIASFGLIAAQVNVDELHSANNVLTARRISEDGLWMVDLPDGIRAMRIHDASGRIVAERKLATGSRSQLVDLRSNSAGVYLLNFWSADGTGYTVKVAKE